MTWYASILIDAMTTSQRGFSLNCLSITVSAGILSLISHKMAFFNNSLWTPCHPGRGDVHPAPTSLKLNLSRCSASG
ncbi:hypothetical protein HZ326_8564 [Fusarium oxysporum f. sp. albedinis]|nr:hypothetical protein HZ326_8564 [Fusarium oxysporum f. sp. albedinis]